MNLIKVTYRSKERDDVYTTLYLPTEDIKHITHDVGVAKQTEGEDLKLERLTITMKNMIMTKVPKTKDGQTILNSKNEPLLVNQERNEMYFVEGEEIYKVLAQFDTTLD